MKWALAGWAPLVTVCRIKELIYFERPASLRIQVRSDLREPSGALRWENVAFEPFQIRPASRPGSRPWSCTSRRSPSHGRSTRPLGLEKMNQVNIKSLVKVNRVSKQSSLFRKMMGFIFGWPLYLWFNRRLSKVAYNPKSSNLRKLPLIGQKLREM